MSGKRAVLRFSMVAGAKTGEVAPSDHSAEKPGNGIRWDIYGSPGAAVRPAFYSSDGLVTLSVTDGGQISGPAGRIAVVTVMISGTRVGVVKFKHLVSVNTSAKSPTDSIGSLPAARPFTNSSGTCYGWPCSENWRVHGPGGIHTHLDIQQGCYRPLATNTARTSTEPLAMLASGYATTNVGACSDDEIRTVNQVAKPSTAGADFDGNGKSDILWYGPGTKKDAMWLATSNGNFKPVSKNVSGTYTPIAGDFDGNGKTDILWYGPGTKKDAMWLATSNGNFKPVSKNVSGTYTPIAGDFDGNGKTDILWYGPGTKKDAMWLATSNGNFKPVSKNVSGTYTPIAGDFDGNGKTDILWYGPGTKKDAMWLATSNGNFKPVSKNVSGTYTPIAGDFDGNGKTDILWYGPATKKDAMWLATSNGNFKPVSKNVSGTYTPIAGDFDGNGKTDILWYGPATKKDAMWLATSNGNFKPVSKNVSGTYTPIPSG